jgi:hypothetical protein
MVALMVVLLVAYSARMMVAPKADLRVAWWDVLKVVAMVVSKAVKMVSLKVGMKAEGKALQWVVSSVVLLGRKLGYRKVGY